MKWIAPHGAATSTERYRNAEPTIAGSNPDAAFFNTVLDELLAVIVAADMTPTDANLHQIADAIVYLTERAATSGVTKGSYWFGKTTANFTVPNPTLPEQNYIDFTTLNTYSAKSDLSGWVQTGTFVPPVGIDFTILITSKFWDIPEQDDQQGGWAQYNHTDDEWSWWPRIINLDNAANLSLSNLNTNGKNIANWSSNVTNCITNIPQDIKLELNNGTLTLKAGSKVYVPNGPGVFDEVVIQNDLITAFGNNDIRLLFVKSGENLLDALPVDLCYSGPSAPSAPSWAQYILWYDTTNNYVKYTNDSGSTWTIQNSLPIAEITTGSDQISSIDQIFNGFGYIGSTVFALPGVKGLIPDGRNADGSLKNIKTSDLTTVKTVQVNTSTAKIAMYSDGGLGSQTKNFGLNEPENYNYDTGVLTNALEVARVYVNSSGKIVTFMPRTAFHAVDNNEILFMLYPVGSLYFGTQDTCPMALLMPGTLWSRVAQKIVVNNPNNVPVKGNGMTLGLTDGSGFAGLQKGTDTWQGQTFGYSVYGKNVGTTGNSWNHSDTRSWGVTTDSTKSGIVADMSSVATITTNVWRRDA